MPTWNSEQYLKFAAERTQPAVDLAARVRVETPRRVMDLGCGPGNSTEVLARRWPGAELAGLDSSLEMIAAARKAHPEWRWSTGDIGTWMAEEPYEVVFSNAALQWVPEHGRVLPQLLKQVAEGGALAMQVPANLDAPAHVLMRELGAAAAWRGYFEGKVREWHVGTTEDYYDLMAPQTARVDLWVTEYQHVLAGPEGLVEWYRGTGLRPWLDALPDEATRARFEADYLEAVRVAYPRRADGRVLFPFRRLFLVAYR
ncbi:MAG: trans-aconitate 2-methyltransferase [Opitutales bacterium]|jgi:trans-aconitate 2-methyltransferase